MTTEGVSKSDACKHLTRLTNYHCEEKVYLMRFNNDNWISGENGCKVFIRLNNYPCKKNGFTTEASDNDYQIFVENCKGGSVKRFTLILSICFLLNYHQSSFLAIIIVCSLSSVNKTWSSRVLNLIDIGITSISSLDWQNFNIIPSRYIHNSLLSSY